MLPDVSRLETLSDADLQALREALSPLTADLVARAEAVLPGALDAVRLPVVQAWWRQQSGPGPLLARLFAYADHLTPAEAEQTLGPLLLRLSEAGVLRTTVEGVSSAYVVMPFEGLWILSDPFGPHDPVMGPGATTYELARAMPATAARALDVGTGAGTLALLLARRGVTKVVATDLSPRAITLTRFNARLNCVHVDARVGDLLAPVAGEQFDLVVAQPPFVVRPAEIDAKTTLHGGPQGDELAFRLLAELDGVLAPQGRALVRFDSPVLSTPLIARVRTALGRDDLRLTVFLGPPVSPERYASAYASAMDPTLGPDYRRYAGAYYRHLLAHGFERTTPSLLALDRRPPHYAAALRPPNLTRADAATIALTETALAMASLDDSGLLGVRLRTQPSARVVQDQPLGGEPHLHLRFSTGVAEDQEIGDSVAVLLDGFGEGATVTAALAAFAAAHGDPGPKEPLLRFVRDALAKGILVPA